MDFSKVKDEDLKSKTLLTPQNILDLVMGNYESLRALGLLIQSKTLYRKAWEAFKIDKDELNPELEEFRARCETEYEDHKKINGGDEDE